MPRYNPITDQRPDPEPAAAKSKTRAKARPKAASARKGDEGRNAAPQPPPVSGGISADAFMSMFSEGASAEAPAAPAPNGYVDSTAAAALAVTHGDAGGVTVTVQPIDAAPPVAPLAAAKRPSALEAVRAALRGSENPQSEISNPQSDESPFGPVIYAYTRRQAIEDGVLVDACIGDLAEVTRQHYKWHVAMTAAVWEVVERAIDHPKACNDVKGVWHDILWMSRKAITERFSPSCHLFEVAISDNHASLKARRHTFKCHCGPGDEGEGVVTIMLPDGRLMNPAGGTRLTIET